MTNRSLYDKIFPLSLSRYRRIFSNRTGHVVNQVSSYTNQFIPFPSETTNTDTCLIGNGIPKSGTHLLWSFFNHLNHWTHTGAHIVPDHWSDSENKSHRASCEFVIPRLRNGMIAGAHVPYNRRVETIINKPTGNRTIKHVLIYRDPRDILCSSMRYVTYNKSIGQRNSEAQKFMNEQFLNDADRLTYIIRGALKSNLAEPGYSYIEYLPWLSSSACFSLKFENLYSGLEEMVDGKGTGKTLLSLAEYINVKIPQSDPENFARSVLGSSPTLSNEQKKVSQYKRMFNDEHYSLCDVPKFRNCMAKFGYDW